jgi:hypothetical protein
VTGVVTYTRDATDEYLAPVGGFLRGAGDDRHRHNTTARVRVGGEPLQLQTEVASGAINRGSGDGDFIRGARRNTHALSRSRSREGIVYLSFRSNFDAFHRVS